MGDNPEGWEGWSDLDATGREVMMRNHIIGLERKIDSFQRLAMNGALAAVGVLFFQALPYLQAIAKAAKP